MRLQYWAVVLFAVTTHVQAAALSRAEAQRAIQKHPEFASINTIPNATHPSFDRGVTDGIWVNTRGGWQPTALGQQYFTSVNMLGMKLAKPLHRSVVAITGISDGARAGTKIVEFTWRFTDLTSALAKYTGATTGDHAGRATFRQYDDGWRIDRLECGSVRAGTNSRAFAEDKTGPRFLGTFQSENPRERFIFRLWSDAGQVTGTVERRWSETVSAVGKIEGSNYDPGGTYNDVTGELTFFTSMEGTTVSFHGTLKNGLVKGAVTLSDAQTSAIIRTEQVTCRKLPEGEARR